ncbi:MAG: hypothetical protein WC783_02345 [Candidatus Paceibacterota bacterium]|jgi:hypothetical protein
MSQDPIQKAEKIVKVVHDSAGKITQPVLKRYPLLFTFLLVFGVSATMNGFKVLVDDIPFFHNHPGYLMLSGILVLLFTGKLYKSLNKTK